MTYTLWSRGRLLGESPLDFVRCLPKLRVGFLHATPLGEKLLPVAFGVTPASLAFGRALQDSKRDCPGEEWHRIPEYADYRSACDEEEALELELRGPDSNVIPTEYVAVRDTEFLNSWGDEAAKRDEEATADEDLDEIIALGDEDDVPPWESHEDDLDEDALIAELEALSADDEADAWRQREERPWMRYQLQVELIHDWSIP